MQFLFLAMRVCVYGNIELPVAVNDKLPSL